jgi:hypothetical protein
LARREDWQSSLNLVHTALAALTPGVLSGER